MWLYWRKVFQRAWRRALELARVESRERIAVFLIAIAFPAFVTWHLVGDHAGAVVRALAAVGGSATAVLVIFVWNVLKLPAEMEKEAAAETAKIAAQIESQEHRKAVREEIGRFLASGTALRRQCANTNEPAPKEDAIQWLTELCQFLEINLGASYVARVNDASAVPLGMSSLQGDAVKIDGGVRVRLFHLEQFLRELA